MQLLVSNLVPRSLTGTFFERPVSHQFSDHKTQHFIIPQMADSSLDLSELAKAAKKKLQALSNHLFEELAMDTYDEVDRRENDALWLSTQNHSTLVTDRQSIPFLPVNPELSSTRNQVCKYMFEKSVGC
jgi:G protein-coupled receptor kinase interacting protein 2